MYVRVCVYEYFLHITCRHLCDAPKSSSLERGFRVEDGLEQSHARAGQLQQRVGGERLSCLGFRVCGLGLRVRV